MLITLAIVIDALLIVTIHTLDNETVQLSSLENNRYQMFQKADELRQSYDDLTRFARMYVATGRTEFKNSYFNVLNIRQGKSERPEDYDNIYWDLLEPLRNQKHPLQNKISLRDQIHKLPFSQHEIELLNQSENDSDTLVLLEIEAFNALIGKFKDKNGAYSITSKPNQSLAIQLLNSQQYLAAKQNIMNPINDLRVSVTERMKDAINRVNTSIEHRLTSFYFILIFTFVCVLAAVYLIFKRLLNPIQSLSNSIHAFRAGEPDTIEKVHYDDEIGDFTRQFFKMRQQYREDLHRIEFALHTANQGWFDIHLPSQTLKMSEQYPEMMGSTLNKAHINYEDWKSSIHDEDRAEVIKAFQSCLKSGQRNEIEYRIKTASGKWCWLHSSAEVIECDENNRTIRIAGVHRNIDHRKRIEIREKARSYVIELLLSGAPLQSVLDAITEAIESDSPSAICSILLTDKEGKHLVSGSAPNLPKFYVEALNGMKVGISEGCCGEAVVTRKRVISENLNTDPKWAKFLKLTCKANLNACWSEPIIDSSSSVLGTFAIYHSSPIRPDNDDIKSMEFAANLAAIAIERHKNIKKLLLSSRIINEMREAIIITDDKVNITDINPAFTSITGYTRNEVINENPRILSSGKQTSHFYADMWKNINEKGYWLGDIWNRKKDGSDYACLQTIFSITNAYDKVQNYICLFSDITLLKKQQMSLEQLAHYDSLTQLPKRTLLKDRFDQALAHSQRDNKMIAICFIDLDHFKPINDNYGHETGDQLLIAFTQRIKGQLRNEDTICRLGGDEFILLLAGIDSDEHCKNLVSRIHDEIIKPYDIEGRLLSIGVSIGITLFPEDNSELDTLIRHADKTMYQAKTDGRNCYRFYTPS